MCCGHCSSTAEQNLTVFRCRNRARFAVALAVLVVVAAWCAPARAVTLFSENFQGYTSFPAQNPVNDYINPGLPRQSEGAHELWYGGRFQPGTVSIDAALAVQKYGGGTNNTHVGRVSDDAGMLFHVSTLNLQTATLDFDWRTFQAEFPDKMVVGYYVGNINFGGSLYHDFTSSGPAWSSWTQILNANPNNSWQHFTGALPAGQADVWVAFWLNGDCADFGKIDNVVVKGTAQVPEPAALFSAASGAGICLVVALRRRAVHAKRQRQS